MSICGKYSFEDLYEDYDDLLEKYQIYACWNDLVPLNMKSKKDAVAYYPYLISMMYSTKDNGGFVHLSSEPFINQEEEEQMEWRLESLLKLYRSCKRKKISFDKEEVIKRICFCPDCPKPHEIELINRVAELGEKATVDGIHDDMHDRMRREWYDLMLENGWGEDEAYRWVYGFQRWVDKYKEDCAKKLAASEDGFGDESGLAPAT